MREKIAWFVPDFRAGSGGHRTIFQNISTLVSSGYECDVYVSHKTSETLVELKERIKENFDFCGNIYDSIDKEKEYDLVFATSWDTVEDAKSANAKKRAYFIQDYEPWFFPKGSFYEAARKTYHEKFYHITIGRWLAKKIREESGVEEVSYFDFCADRGIYHEIIDAKKEKAICAIFQPDKPRRCADVVLRALKLFKSKHPDYKIYLYGSSDYYVSGLEAENMGVISPQECNLLYNKCIAGVCVSTSNPSRIPFEMMSAGLPVVEYYEENTIYDLPSNACLLSNLDENSIVKALEKIIENPQFREKLLAGGKKYMETRDLPFGFEQFKNAVRDILENNHKIKPIFRKCYLDAPISSELLTGNSHKNDIIINRRSKDPQDSLLEEKVKILETEVNNIKNSHAYRFGLKASALSQQIRKMFTKLSNHK